MLALKRSLYRTLLRIHPTEFRDRFAREMALDFEDALVTYGFSRLLADATRSLARQWTAAPISFARAAAPIPLHPLLAGQYLDLDNDSLKPFEFLRGSLLFLVLLFLVGIAFNAPGNRIPSGHLPGLPANQADAFRHAQDGPFQPTPGERSRYAVLVPDRGARLHPGSEHFFLRVGQTAGRPTSSLPETWRQFLLRCAIVSAIVWLTSFLVRRSRTLGMRVAFIALGLIAVVVAAAFVPIPAPRAFARR